MDKKKFFIITILIFVLILSILTTVVIKSSPPWHFSDKDIGYIQIIQSSHNGNTVDITDSESIIKIIQGLESKKYKFTRFNIGIGWTYRILIYDKQGRLKDEYQINHDNSLSYSFGVYSFDDTDISFITHLFD